MLHSFLFFLKQRDFETGCCVFLSHDYLESGGCCSSVLIFGLIHFPCMLEQKNILFSHNDAVIVIEQTLVSVSQLNSVNTNTTGFNHFLISDSNRCNIAFTLKNSVVLTDACSLDGDIWRLIFGGHTHSADFKLLQVVEHLSVVLLIVVQIKQGRTSRFSFFFLILRLVNDLSGLLFCSN